MAYTKLLRDETCFVNSFSIIKILVLHENQHETSIKTYSCFVLIFMDCTQVEYTGRIRVMNSLKIYYMRNGNRISCLYVDKWTLAVGIVKRNLYVWDASFYIVVIHRNNILCRMLFSPSQLPQANVNRSILHWQVRVV